MILGVEDGGGAGALPWMTSIAFSSQSVTTFAQAPATGVVIRHAGTTRFRSIFASATWNVRVIHDGMIVPFIALSTLL